MWHQQLVKWNVDHIWKSSFVWWAINADASEVSLGKFESGLWIELNVYDLWAALLLFVRVCLWDCDATRVIDCVLKLSLRKTLKSHIDLLYLFLCFVVELRSEGGELLGQPLRHVFVGVLDLRVSGAGVGELVVGVGLLQVPPHAGHVWGDVVVAVLLSNNLGKEAKLWLWWASRSLLTPPTISPLSWALPVFIHSFIDLKSF